MASFGILRYRENEIMYLTFKGGRDPNRRGNTGGNYIERTPFIKVIVSIAIACISLCLGVLVQNVS